MTVRDAAKRTLRLLGVLATGENPSADELQDAIVALKSMLASWSTDGFAVQARIREEFDLVAGQATYSIGTDGNFDTPRPIEIERVTIKEVTPSPSFETSVDLINTEEYASIQVKDTISIPTKVYRDGAYPLLNLTFYPVPDVARKAVIYSRKNLLDIVSANTELALPEGYERAIVYNWAIELAPEYGKSIPQEIATIAIDSKAAVMRLNGGPQYLETGPMLAGVNYFNIYTGEI